MDPNRIDAQNDNESDTTEMEIFLNQVDNNKNSDQNDAKNITEIRTINLTSNVLKSVKDPVVESIGQFGLWQLWIFFLMILFKFPVGSHQVAIVFLAPEPEFKCGKSENFTNICTDECKEGNIKYDKSIFTNTIIMDWNLICDKKFFAGMSQTIFMFGILLGNVLFGMWSDKQGRKTPLVFATVLQTIFGIAAAFSPLFWMFCISRFLVGFATGGTMLTSFCLLMEAVGPKKREIISVLYNVPFNVGHASLPIFSYFLRDWRWYQFALSFPSIFLISTYWLVPESPRWLIAHGKVDEAINVLEKAAIINGRNKIKIRDNVEEYVRQREQIKDSSHSASTIDLFRYPNLRMKTIFICFNWMICGISYFGVSQYVGDIGGNIFLNVAMSGILGVPGALISVPLTKYWGRKPTTILANILITITMLTMAGFYEEKFRIYKVCLASAGIFATMILFSNCYTYSSELFPTVVRNSGMGISSMTARAGAMIAPHLNSLHKFGSFIPPTVFGIGPLIAALLTLYLPETLNQPLPESIKDGEQFGKKSKQ